MAAHSSHNLPIALSSFIGREAETAEVRRLLGSTRLLTLTGAGGVGKTRLALQVAAGELFTFTDGVWFAELAVLTDPALISSSIASAVGVREELSRPILATLGDHFRALTMLLVLDNCEHLIADAARVCDALLRAAPELKIMATSREALGIPGETVYRVPSLDLPRGSMPIEMLSHIASVLLFTERAKSAKTDFTLTPGNAPAIAEICRRLDGIPLAIELAAARSKVLTPEQIVTRLNDRFRLLTGGSRTALPRQQTLRATVDWSHNLLSEPERMLLRRLAVFAGGWTLEAAEAVCAADGLESDNILDLLTQLVDKSLVVAEMTGDETRYRLLETVRQYEREKLLDAGEVEQVRTRHMEYCLRYAELFEAHTQSQDQVLWRSRLAIEVDNMRAAIEWAMQARQTRVALQLAAALDTFWLQQLPDEGLQRLASVLRVPAAASHLPERARALNAQGHIQVYHGNHNAARASFEEALAAARAAADERLIRRSLALLGETAVHQHDHETARACLTECLEKSRTASDTLCIADSLHSLGILAFSQGDTQAAQALLEESLSIWVMLKEKLTRAAVLRYLGYIAMQQQDYVKASALFRESLALNSAGSDTRGVAACLTATGALCVACERTKDALHLLGAAHSVLGFMHTGMLRLDQEQYDGALAKARENLNPAEYDAAWAEGNAMTLNIAIQAAGCISMMPATRPTGAPPIASTARLTPREAEVLRWLACGLSDAEIAEQLVLSVRTVSTHLHIIYGKLGVRNRIAAVRAASDMKLV